MSLSAPHPQPHGLSCQENVIKECGEEASVPAALAAGARAAGAVSYTALQPAGLKRDVLFCYDLELPLDFVPQPQVGGCVCGGGGGTGRARVHVARTRLTLLD